MTDAIRVLIVDDSASVRRTLTAILAGAPDIKVIGTASDPFAAARRLAQEMPRTDGLTFLRKIMTRRPVPIIVCSTLTAQGSQVLLDVTEAGAVDILPKPRVDTTPFLIESSIRVCDAVRGAAQAGPKARGRARPLVEAKLSADAMLPPCRSQRKVGDTDRIVCIGASTGGTEAVATILRALPADRPGIAVVQHMPQHFTAAFAKRLNGLLEMRQAGAMTVAQDADTCVLFGMPKEAIERGAVVRVVPLQHIHRDVLHASAPSDAQA